MDKVGEGRACWSLGNAHAAMGNHDKALHYAQRHLEISREVNVKQTWPSFRVWRGDFVVVVAFQLESVVMIESGVRIGRNRFRSWKRRFSWEANGGCRESNLFLHVNVLNVCPIPIFVSDIRLVTRLARRRRK